jgi:hypothetical protein
MKAVSEVMGQEWRIRSCRQQQSGSLRLRQRSQNTDQRTAVLRGQVLDHRHAEISQAGIIAIRIDDQSVDLRFDLSDDMGNDGASAAERLKEFVTRNATFLHAA